MAAKIKLKRIGTKNKAIYRVVVQDESFSTSGSIVENLGQYNPLEEPVLFEIDKERVQYWIGQGAQPTDKVRILLGKAGVLPPVSFEGRTKRKSKSQSEETPAEAAPVKEEAKAAPVKEELKAEEAPAKKEKQEEIQASQEQKEVEAKEKSEPAAPEKTEAEAVSPAEEKKE